MKIRFILLVAIFCHCTSVAQTELSYDPVIEVHFNRTPMASALRQMGDSAKMTILVVYENLRYARKVTLDTVGRLSLVMDLCLKQQPLQLLRLGDQIAVIPADLEGIVTDMDNNPLYNINVSAGDSAATTDMRGYYKLKKAAAASNLTFSAINYEPVKVVLNGQTKVSVKMRFRVNVMDSIEVYNGYGFIPRERQTGSFTLLNTTALNQSPEVSVLDRMKGRTIGIVYNNIKNEYTNEPNMQIRGLGSIYASSTPLVVLDDFPFPGDIRSINPNDVASVSILRDAAAASVWGAKAGNGVIVIVTKKAKEAQPFNIQVNSNVTLISPRNLFYMPQLSPGDFSELEQLRYDSGYYNDALLSNATAVSQNIEILEAFKNGKISAAVRDAELAILKEHDVRDEMKQHFLRKGMLQQHYINLSGSDKNVAYNFSGGYSREMADQVNAFNRRIHVNAGLLYKKGNFEFAANSRLHWFRDRNAGQLPDKYFPNSFIFDASGAPAVTPVDIRQPYKDSMNKEGILPDWNYRLADELKQHELTLLQNGRLLNGAMKYTMFKNIVVSVQYQLHEREEDIKDYSPESSYKARHRINSYAQYENGQYSFPIPKGGILAWEHRKAREENSRFQINWDFGNPGKFRISGLAGAEFNKITYDSTSGLNYGYNPDQTRQVLIDGLTRYKMLYNNQTSLVIPTVSEMVSGFNYRSSIYANAGIVFKGRYHVTGSIRADESNLFGPRVEGKRIPLWSIGMRWDLNEDSALKISWLAYLNVRGSTGTSGNINNTKSAYATVERAPLNNLGQTPVTIASPNNDHLRWEQSNMTNIAVEWADVNRHFQFTFEYYWRKSQYLLAMSKQDPTLGYTNYWDNSARMKGQGYDFSVQANIASNNTRFSTLFWLSRATTQVTRFDKPETQAHSFVDNRLLSPRVGYPVYSVNAFRWAGLNPQTGDPQVFYGGKASMDYKRLLASAPDSSLVHLGSSIPTVVGALTPMLSYKNFTICLTVIGKFNYYFRRGSILYATPYTNTLAGNNDYPDRWRQPGDEQRTNVPSIKILQDNDRDRDNVYAAADILVERADNIRISNMKFELDLTRAFAGRWGMKRFSVYAIMGNVATVWKATDTRVDPDYLGGPPPPRMYTLGVCFDVK